MTDWMPVLAAVVVLCVIAMTVMRVAHLPAGWAPLVAVVRCVLQLAVISLVLSGVIADARWVAVALAVMFLVASSTSARRLGPEPLDQGHARGGLARRLGISWRRYGYIAGAMFAGAAVTFTVIFATRALPAQPRYFLAVGGIIIGNSMSIATLAGRRFFTDLNERWEEVEGWLALGAKPRDATTTVRRQAAYEALVPSIDQTKTTGLVTLPGAFVGAIFGGASPVEAGRFQVLVLTGILAAGSITGVLLLRALAPVTVKPDRL